MAHVPPAPETWTVLEHGPLEPLADGCWRIVGALPNMALPRTCVVAKHRGPEGEGLVIHSAIAVRDDVLEAILVHGEPRWLVVPNALHRLDAPAWKARFPHLRVICPPPAPETWTVLEHGPLEPLADGCWRIVGALPNMALPRTCVVAKHRGPEGEGLVIHSAIAVRDDVLEAILVHGEPRWLVVPNALHRLDAPAWKARFPHLRVICPPAAQDAVTEKVPVDATYDALSDTFTPESGVTLRPLDGIDGKEWVLRVHHPDDSVSLVVTDAVFNVPHQRGFGGLILRLIGSSGGPKVTFIARSLMVKDKARLAADLRTLAQTPSLARLVPAHGDVVEGDVGAVLRSVADALHR